MNLTIDGFAKIGHADIKLNGVTVIAGENNSGKSTVGKILYCLVNAFYDVDRYIYAEKKQRLSRELRFIASSAKEYPLRTYPLWRDNALIREILSFTVENSGDDERLRSLILSKLKPETDKGLNDLDVVLKHIVGIIRMNDEALKAVIVSRQFSMEFDGQVNNLNDAAKPASAVLSTDNGEQAHVRFEENKCTDFSRDYMSRTGAIYIDTPFVIDRVRESWAYPLYADSVMNHRDSLAEKLASNNENSIFDEAVNRSRLERIGGLLSRVTAGQFVRSDGDDGDSFDFKEDGYKSALHLSNLSTGLKTFVIIKRLIENASIAADSTLILDEPEIHLHPAWQLAFAEILLLLQKEFNLTILLNTHSPYFLSAIETYSAKHGTTEKCSYYLSDLDDGCARFIEVTSDTEPIYKKLATPFQTLENVKYEIN